MGVGHSHPLYIHEHSPLHRLAPEAKIVASFALVMAIALTPRQSIWAFGVHAGIVGALAALGRVPARFLAIRLAALTPFVAFAVFIPFFASGETMQLLGVRVSIEGLWGAWNVLAKAVLGASVTVVLTATTEIPDILRGLGVLRVPVLFTSIAVFMIRYLELVADELGRMRVAMTARGYDPHWLSQARPIAASAGALFVRSYERGERVHDAMLSRGYSGVMPRIKQEQVPGTVWAWVGTVVLMAGLTTTLALVTG